MTADATLTHLDIICLWPNVAALARDVGTVQAPAVRHWKRTGHIPPLRYDDVISAAKRRGFKGVTYAALAAGAPRPDQPTSA